MKKTFDIQVLGKGNPYQGKESDLQRATAQLVSYYPILRRLAFHVPNERGAGRKDEVAMKRVMAIQRKKLAGQGVKDGVADWIVLIPRGPYHGLAIEVKAKKNTTTASQNDFLADAAAQGYKCFIVYNLEAFQEALEWYLSL